MADIEAQMDALAGYLRGRRDAILQAWRAAIKKDPALATGDALPQVDLYDHIPALLRTFERKLRELGAHPQGLDPGAELASAAAHGLQRWQQGYDLREVTRELGRLNQCVVAELESHGRQNPSASREAMPKTSQ